MIVGEAFEDEKVGAEDFDDSVGDATVLGVLVDAWVEGNGPP